MTILRKQYLRLRRAAKKIQQLKEWAAGQFRYTRGARKKALKKIFKETSHQRSATGAYAYKAKQVKLGKGKQTFEGIPINRLTHLIKTI
jgi:hypothetical protein